MNETPGKSRRFAVLGSMHISKLLVLSRGIVFLVFLVASGCIKTPAPSSYEATHPHVYQPYLATPSSPGQDEDERLSRLQLLLLDPPGTMSMVGRAVENHRRALEEKDMQAYLESRKAKVKTKTQKSRKKETALVSVPPRKPPQGRESQALPPDLASLGVTCQFQPAKDWKQAETVSILEQRNCLPSGQPMASRRLGQAKVHFSGIKGNLWDLVRSGLALHAVDHPRLEGYLSYLREKPGTVDFLMARAEPYLRYLSGELKQRDLPLDIIMVPMVESAFQTTAVSPKQAAGLWQFVPATGQQYGLRLADNYDGRYDTHAATQAALRYLRYLNDLFRGDWLLTLAAYNAGEGTVQRAILASRQVGGAGQFWDLGLPVETQNYVLKILALSRIVSNPNANGFIPRDARPAQSLVHLELKPGIRIRELIDRSGMAPQEFFKLNPHVRPDITPPVDALHFMIPEQNLKGAVGQGENQKNPTS